jgi:DNA-binding NarL/FixJ family response regulator
VISPGGLAELLAVLSLATDLGVGQPLEHAPRTVDHRVQHIYDRARMKPRAGATLFALKHDLLK